MVIIWVDRSSGMKITEGYIRSGDTGDFVYEVNKVLLESNENEINIELKHCKLKTKYAYERFVYMTNNDYGLKNIAFPIIEKKNVVIDGQGARLDCIGRILPFYITDSENVTIKNFVIDYKRPMFSQGEIVAVGSDYFVLDIDKEKYPYIIKNGILVFVGEDYTEEFVHGMLEFEKETKRPVTDASDISVWSSLRAEELQNGQLKILYNFKKRIPKIGNMLSIKHERRYVPAIAVNSSKNITLENITIYHAGTMGVVAQFSENITLKNVQVKLEDGSDRIVSANADATHFVGCKGTLLVEGCRFENQLDDSINVHGNYLRVTKIIDDSHVVVEIPHRQQVGAFGLEIGAELTLHNDKTMLLEGSAKLADYKVINNKYYELYFTQPFDFKDDIDYCIENAQAYPVVIFRNNICGKNRARSILLSGAKDILVEGNIVDSEGACIKISGDMDNWYESGATSNVVIRNNKFSRRNTAAWGKAIFDIDPEMEENEDGRYYHKNILIEDNEITINDLPLFYGQSVEKITVRGNTFVADGLKSTADMPIKLAHVGELVFENNFIKGASEE